MIEIKNLSKKYKDFYALKDINLTLPSKGLIGISGESGSGKSTLLNALALMEDNYQGEIIINKKNILRFKNSQKDKFHLSIGYIFQNPYLFNSCTIKENIQYISLIKGKREKIDNILKLVGLEKYKNKKVSSLSGGQRQRVSIASSLISKPKILLCDEPTGSLDSDNSKRVMQILKEVSKETLVILVSHDLNLLKQYADTIIFLKNGEVINKLENIDSEEKFKYNKKNLISYLKFIFKFSFKNIFNQRKRTMLTSIMVSFGLIGIIISILLKDGFSSFFEVSLGAYEPNKYMYCYNVSNNETIEVSLDTFEVDFKDYDKGYFYKYDFKEDSNYENKISINDSDIYLNFNNLKSIIRDNYFFENNQIGLCCSNEYIDYFAYLFKVNNINQINKYLKENETFLSFKYIDNQMNISFKLQLTYLKESKNEYTYFIHSSPLFLKEYFNNYLSNDFNNDSKVVIIPYIESGEINKSDLLLNENKKKYDYLFDNKIYDKTYDFVFKSNYYRIDISLAEEMSKEIDSTYFFSMEKGLDMMGYFSEDMTISSINKEINGKEVSFVPNNDSYNSINEIKISRGLNDLLENNIIKIKGYNQSYNFYVKDIIEDENLIIYQNSYWSYSLFRDLFLFKDYECIGLSIGFSKSDNESLEILKEKYNNFEFICPLREVKKEIDGMVEKIQIVLIILSSFCIIISLLLMAIIMFINTIEQAKIIATLRINGISKKDVLFIYILESLLLGFISFLISSYFSFIFSFELNIVFNALLNDQNIKIIELKKDTLINVFKIVMLMSFISGVIPALIAANKKSLKVLKS